MTDYSYQAVGDVMARIMDNVIRRYMSESGWYGTWDEGFRGNNWDGLLPGKFGASGTVQLRQNGIATGDPADPPPGSRYLGTEQEGTITYFKYEVDPDALYLPWVERVNDAFLGWRSLPDPADFEGPIRHLEQAVNELTPEEQGDWSYAFVNVEVTNAIDLMRRWISPQGNNSSDLLYAFDSAYGVGRITGVMTNQAQVAAGLGFTVAGEKQVWTKARHDIMEIATAAADALDIEGGGGGLSIDLGIVKAFVDLVAVFVPKQYQILTSAVSAGLGFLDAIIPEQKTEAKAVNIDGFTADEMLSSRETSIKDLESAIYDEELELAQKLRTLKGILGGGRGASDFHIHPGAGVDNDFTDAAEIRFNSEAVQGVGTENVPTVAAAFLRSAEEASAQTGPGIWTRDNLIGFGNVGPHYDWAQVVEEFDAITTGSAKELVAAGKILAVAAGWIEDSDVEAALDAQGLKDELARGETGWSYTYP